MTFCYDLDRAKKRVQFQVCDRVALYFLFHVNESELMYFLEHK